MKIISNREYKMLQARSGHFLDEVVRRMSAEMELAVLRGERPPVDEARIARIYANVERKAAEKAAERTS